MYYLIKESSINELRKKFVTGGVGINYRDPSITMRHIVHNKEDALVFDTIEDASQFLCQGYVIATEVEENVFKIVN